jgi:transcriptional regulator GlxA family with amidase domain
VVDAATFTDLAFGANDEFPTFHAMRTIAFLIFPGFQLLDTAGPIAAFEMAAREVEGAYRLAVVAADPAFLGEIRRLAEGAAYVTSVCTGSLILGAAGLLRGKRAACHWAWRDLLPLFGAIPDAGRVVRDGRLITGGGVTAGVDFAFTVLAEIAGEDVAQMIQLGLEYAPQPPFDAGRPELARPEILARYNALLAPRMVRSRAEAETLGGVEADIEDRGRVGEGAH